MDKVDVIIGTQSGGQGHETSFAQVIESWLGVPMNDVNLITGDSDIVQEGGGTHSDRSIRLGGFVMVKASEQIIEKGKKIAAHLMEAAASDIQFGAGKFTVSGTDRSVTLFEAARAAASDKVPEDLRGPLAGDAKFVGRIPAYPNGCAAACLLNAAQYAAGGRSADRCSVALRLAGATLWHRSGSMTSTTAHR